jgi:tetratricopeptide (TPR) repeat protein
LLLVKLDDWNRWQQQLGSKEAAQKANEVLEVSRGDCSNGDTLDWVGPDRFGVFLRDADRESAQQLARAIRNRVKAELDTTVSIGLSVHPCPGFTMREILENARKALVHTGFFGSNTQTLFDATSLNINGDRLYEAGRMEDAVQEFKLALTLDPHNVNVRNSLGVCYAQMGKFEEAVNEFSGVAALEAEDFMPHYNLGCALLSLERLDEAERVLTRAAELEPNSPAVCLQAAQLYRRQNRLEEALVHLDRAVAMQPGWAQAWRLHGDCHLDKGADDEAMDSFKKALKFNGKDTAALSGLATCYGRTEANLEIGLSLARLSVELEPDNPQFLQRLAELLLKSQLIDEALKHYQRAVSLAPEDEQIRSLQRKIADAQRASTS